jgi:hypothetical protein
LLDGEVSGLGAAQNLVNQLVRMDSLH